MDTTKERDFFELEQWDGHDDHLFIFDQSPDEGGNPKIVANSFSGSERNRLFLQTDGNFHDATLASGIDFRADGRGFALFDYDNDGATDIGLISNQSPRFRLLRNNMAASTEVGNHATIRLVGGNDTALPSRDFSSRDPFGAKVRVKIGDQVRLYQLGCGEGLSSQNSNAIHVVMGAADSIDEVTVIWPSGKISNTGSLKAGSSITVDEKPHSGPSDK